MAGLILAGRSLNFTRRKVQQDYPSLVLSSWKVSFDIAMPKAAMERLGYPSHRLHAAGLAPRSLREL